MADFERTIMRDIERRLFEKGKIVVLYGPRQVGKTTLAKKILSEHGSEDGYFNCEEQPVSSALSSGSSDMMDSYFSGAKVIVLDEAQTVKNIGRALKIFIDAFPEKNIIATGSSSFDLANKMNEPLTGRHYEYFLYPLSFHEIKGGKGNRVLYEGLEQRLIYGCYPEIVLSSSISDAEEKLKNLISSYLYKDIYKFGGIKNPDLLSNILRALAYQVGSEVSMNELASLVGADKNTVASYIRLLEQAFVIFRLSSFSRNNRNEIKKGKKFYFYDNGLISALTENYSGAGSGRNVGGIWENLMVSERLKYNQRKNLYKNIYFWRLKNAGEIDYIEESNGELTPFEIKWNSEKISPSAKIFESEYGSKKTKVVNKNNFAEFVL